MKSICMEFLSFDVYFTPLCEVTFLSRPFSVEETSYLTKQVLLH